MSARPPDPATSADDEGADARLRAAMQHAPDAEVRPPAALRQAVLQAAREALPARSPWWKRLLGEGPGLPRAWTAAASLGAFGLALSLAWHMNNEAPTSEYEPMAAVSESARPAPAAPPAAAEASPNVPTGESRESGPTHQAADRVAQAREREEVATIADAASLTKKRDAATASTLPPVSPQPPGAAPAPSPAPAPAPLAAAPAPPHAVGATDAAKVNGLVEARRRELESVRQARAAEASVSSQGAQGKLTANRDDRVVAPVSVAAAPPSPSPSPQSPPEAATPATAGVNAEPVAKAAARAVAPASPAPGMSPAPRVAELAAPKPLGGIRSPEWPPSLANWQVALEASARPTGWKVQGPADLPEPSRDWWRAMLAGTAGRWQAGAGAPPPAAQGGRTWRFQGPDGAAFALTLADDGQAWLVEGPQQGGRIWHAPWSARP
ncbi:hypothetical protein AACH06_06295 [Ideonella sp. DXS29W]|uniref:Uncharacterized protein n=1 Tax=Ideonella lacteola TaxID=2984193 RepID=A0ABU9BKF1_9BURK